MNEQIHYLAIFRNKHNEHDVRSVTFPCDNLFSAPRLAIAAFNDAYSVRVSQFDLLRLELAATAASPKHLLTFSDLERTAFEAVAWHGFCLSSTGTMGVCVHWRIVRKLVERGLLQHTYGEFNRRHYSLTASGRQLAQSLKDASKGGAS